MIRQEMETVADKQDAEVVRMVSSEKVEKGK